MKKETGCRKRGTTEKIRKRKIKRGVTKLKVVAKSKYEREREREKPTKSKGRKYIFSIIDDEVSYPSISQSDSRIREQQIVERR